jgi:hypothetical protein
LPTFTEPDTGSGVFVTVTGCGAGFGAAELEGITPKPIAPLAAPITAAARIVQRERNTLLMSDLPYLVFPFTPERKRREDSCKEKVAQVIKISEYWSNRTVST